MTRFLALLGLMATLALPGMAADLGDDGLHKADWMRDTFLDLREDLAEANAEGKRMAILFEQRGCIYCQKMHTEVFPRPEVANYITDNYFVVQLNLHGAREVTDFDGEILTERQMSRKWGMLFTPTMFFLPPEAPDGVSAAQASVATMPGAFSALTTLDMLTWVVEKRYLQTEEEDFQRYHARRLQERGATSDQ